MKQKLEIIENTVRNHRVEYAVWKESQCVSMMNLATSVNKVNTSILNTKQGEGKESDTTNYTSPPPPTSSSLPSPLSPPLTDDPTPVVLSGASGSETTTTSVNIDHHNQGANDALEVDVTVQNGTEDIEFMLFMDSNHQHIDWDRFWRTKEGPMRKIFKGSLWDMEGIIKADTQTRTVKHILISVGVNDADTKTAEEILDQAKKVMNLVEVRYGGPNIVFAELTPRNDEKDQTVKDCNAALKAYTSKHWKTYI